MRAPSSLITVSAIADIELGPDPQTGREALVLPAGTFITLGVGAANRDPEVFANPHRLDIGRRPIPQLAFGHGAHACAGMSVARLEARIAIGRLIARFPSIRPAAPAVRDRRIRFRGLKHLPVELGAPGA